MNNNRKYILLFIVLSSLFADFGGDARMIGLSNAYTNISSGYSCIGINPANLATSPSFTMNLGSFSMGIKNNSLSFRHITDINGSDMVDSTNVANYYDKDGLHYLLNDGFVITSEFNSKIPILNLSIKNYALTSNTNIFYELGIPTLLLEFMFFGNTVGEKININIPYNNIQVVHETGFSYASEYKNIYYGITLKHLLGVFHTDLIDVDEAYFLTDTSSFVFEGSYLLRQGLGGNGFSADFGIMSKEFYDGYQLGISIINLFGQIDWSSDGIFRSFSESIIYPALSDELHLKPNEYIYYHFIADSLNVKALADGGTDNIFSSENYNVIKVSDTVAVSQFNYDSGLVVELPNSDGFLIPSGNMDDEVIKMYSKNNNFATNYPTLLRMAISRKLLNDATMECDFITSFTNNRDNSTNWIINIGAEITRFPDYPIRLGATINNSSMGISFGSGIHKQHINFDYALSLIDGLTLSRAKGFKIAMGISWQ